MRKFLVAVLSVAALAAFVITASGAGATPVVSLSFDKTTGVTGAPGSVSSLGSVAVPASEVGTTCTLKVATQNNESVHLGTVITASTGSDSVTLLHSEDAANTAPSTSAVVKLGATLSATLTLGSDGVSSVAGTVTVEDCQSPPPPTTAPPVTTTKPPVTTTAPPATTTPPAPPKPPAAPPRAVVARPGFTG